MRSANPATIALLNSSQQLRIAECYTLSIVNGGADYRYTTWDADVAYNGDTFSASGPLIERSTLHTVIGVEVDTMDLTITPQSTDMIGAQTFMQAIASGVFDGGTVKFERVFLDATGTPVGGYIAFLGDFADIELTRFDAHVVVNSKLHILNVKLPRNLYQPGCLHTLYDADCGVVRASFAQAGTVGTATRTSVATTLPQADAYFDTGYIQFDTGALTGVKRTVKSWAGGTLALLYPLPLAPSPGDTFTVYPGCDKKQATCETKFSNVVNYRGLPYIPQPETAR